MEIGEGSDQKHGLFPTCLRDNFYTFAIITVKPVLSGHSKKKTKNWLSRPIISLNAGQKYCKMLLWSILQYFRPSLSYHLSLRPLFCLFLIGLLREVLLYQNLLSWSIRYSFYGKYFFQRLDYSEARDILNPIMSCRPFYFT